MVFCSYPLMIAAMSVPFLGECRMAALVAIAAGFVGAVLALDRKSVFRIEMILPSSAPHSLRPTAS